MSVETVRSLLDRRKSVRKHELETRPFAPFNARSAYAIGYKRTCRTDALKIPEYRDENETEVAEHCSFITPLVQF